MGVVYRARDTRLGREVAVKVLPEQFAKDAHRRERFEREARAVAALSHPNILALHDVGTHEGITYAVMELLEGETLRSRLNRGALPWREAVRVGAAIADGLAAAHAKGIIHRDIKPENIVLTTDSRVKILDFGLARFTPPPSSQSETGPYVAAETEAGTILGTVGYMSPEQVRGQPTDARSDLFSLGCVLYEMVDGRRPFRSATAAETMTAVMHDEPPDLTNSGLQVAPELIRLIRQCLVKNPHQRLQSSHDLALGLRATVSESSPTVPAQASRATRPILVVMAALLLIGVSAASVYFFTTGRKSESTKPADEARTVEAVAVLPFENLGGDARSEYLSDGLADHLISSLGKVRRHELKVRPFTSVSRYKKQRPDVRAMGRELNVQMIVTGTLHQQGDDLTTSVELVDAQEDSHIWGSRYQGKLSEILELQDQIARDVAAHMRLRLTGDEEQRLTKRGTQNSEAYRLYLKGRHFWNKRTEEGFRKGIDEFQAAIAKDPAFAPAYAGLADSYVMLATYGFVSPREAMPLAKAAALKALEMDEEIAEAHTALAFIRERYDWNWSEAEREHKRALELNPNYPTAHLWYAYFLGNRGRFEESQAESRRAQELDPLSLVASSTVGWAYYFARDYDQAIVHLNKTMVIDPKFWLAHDYLGRAYFQKGMYEEALAAFQKANTLAPDTPIVLAELAFTYVACKKMREAQTALHQLTELSKRRYVPAFVFAVAYSGLGEKERAIDWLKRAYEERSDVFAYEGNEPTFDGLRSDPRVMQMLKTVTQQP
jgi:serine/threonine protein kinase/tetratricopeptide (TPR) repeat protein